MSIIIGAITLRDFEVPSTVRFGGSQRLVEHRLGNGRTLIEALGADEGDIAFDGVLSGPEASARARTLDMMRRAGEVVVLAWDSFLHAVIVREFRADYANSTWIPYRLQCAIVPQPTSSESVALTPLQLVKQDLYAAASSGSRWSPRLSSLVSKADSGAFLMEGPQSAAVAELRALRGDLDNDLSDAMIAMADSDSNLATARAADLLMLAQCVSQMALAALTQFYVRRAILRLLSNAS